MIINNKDVKKDEDIEKKVQYYLSKLPKDFFDKIGIINTHLITLTENVK
jgi:hypothetical protein